MGDVLEIWTKRGRSTIKVDKTTKLKDSGAEFQINGRDFSLRNVRKSDRVFRVKSAEGAFEVDVFAPKVPVNCKVELKVGKPSKISFIPAKNTPVPNWATEPVLIEGSVVEEARTKAVTKQEVKEHICRLGQTPFKIQNIEIDLDENVGIGFSTLHHLRADALKLLERKILQTDRPQLPQRKPNKNIKNNIAKHDPIIVKSDELFSSQTFCDKLGDVQRNISKREAFEVGPHLPIANVEAVYYFKKLGAKRIWLSPELSINQIKEITKHFPEMSFGLFIMGPQELMITRHCILMSEAPCDQNCKKCKRRAKDHYLLDRKGYEFPVTTDVTGRSHIYNSVSLDVCHALDELKAAGIDSFLVDTTLMSSSEAEAVFSRAQQALTSAVEKSQNTTTGHLFREVL